MKKLAPVIRITCNLGTSKEEPRKGIYIPKNYINITETLSAPDTNKPLVKVGCLLGRGKIDLLGKLRENKS